MSVTVRVWLPAVSRVAKKNPDVIVNTELGGNCAWLSVLVNLTVPE